MTLQDAFREGYTAAPDAENPYLWSAITWEGFELGKYFRRTGRDYDLLKKSRGHTYKSTRGEHYRIGYTPFTITLIRGSDADFL
jgi:hypothetical protein